MTASFRSLALVAACAVATLIAIDVTLQRFLTLQQMREVADGMAQLESSDPEVLVLGSSHARTFHVLGEQLALTTKREAPLVAIPLENGKLVPYNWLLNNRIAPRLDEKRADGSPRYSKLRRLILLTEWWDSCAHPDNVHWNLPSRAWTTRDYLLDILARGMDSYNRNFAQYQFRRWLGFSMLARDRSDPTLRRSLPMLIAGEPLGPSASEYSAQMAAWRKGVERGSSCIGNAEQLAALDSILAFATSRRLETTVVLFPRKPGTLTDLAKSTTLAKFVGMVDERARPRGVRVLDLTWKNPLTDDDFMADFDHVNAAGNLKFARWALENDLSFLLSPPTTHTVPPGPASTTTTP